MLTTYQLPRLLCNKSTPKFDKVTKVPRPLCIRCLQYEIIHSEASQRHGNKANQVYIKTVVRIFTYFVEVTSCVFENDTGTWRYVLIFVLLSLCLQLAHHMKEGCSK